MSLNYLISLSQRLHVTLPNMRTYIRHYNYVLENTVCFYALL